jgi:hypothetical protein
MTPSCYAAATRSTEVPISRAQHELDTELRLSIGDVVEQERAGPRPHFLGTGSMLQHQHTAMDIV